MVLQGPVAVNGDTSLTNCEFLVRHNSGGKFGFFRASGIVGSDVIIIPDGTDDVAKAVYLVGVASNNVPQNMGINYVCLITSPNNTQDSTIDAGTNKLTFTVATATGQLTVKRTAGTATWEISLVLMWL